MADISTEILMKAAEGDLGAFEAIYNAYAGFVHNVAYRVISSAQDAEEVTQEVFLNVYHNLKDFRSESSLKTWIYRIAANCAINYAKKTSRDKERMKRYDENLYTERSVNEPPAQVESKDPEERIGSLLKVLNPDQRACVVLRNIEGLSYAAIADALKVNINTVRSRLKRAREKLLSLRKEVIRDEL